jgi:3-oxoacid CoA-transferase B subunit
MKPRLDKKAIASRVAREFESGMLINLGYGMPSLCANYIPMEKTVYFMGENGVLGYKALEKNTEPDYELINASDQPVARAPGMCFFDSAMSFDLVRGGHIDVAVLGAYQVSHTGDLANWGRPGRPAAGMGGGMDLAVGCSKLYVMMQHTTKDGGFRIVKNCSFPLTAQNCVDRIFTDIAVIDMTQDGPILKEVAPEWTAEEVQELTEVPLIVASDVTMIEI